MEWYYLKGEEQVGPVSEQDIHGLAQRGEISKDTLVWNADMSDWAEYATLGAATAATQAVVEEAPSVATVPVEVSSPETAVGAPDGSEKCRECGSSFPPEDMLQYEGRYVCAGCKTGFFKKVEEGAAMGGYDAYFGTGGQTPVKELVQQARENVRGNWGTGIGAIFVYNIVTGMAAQFCYIPFFFVYGAMTIGLAAVFMAFARNEEATVGMLFESFKPYGRNTGGPLLMSLLVTLWSFLLIVPGIIKGLSYGMTIFILKEDEECSAMDAIRKSAEMMDGHKMRLFKLGLRYMAWCMLLYIPYFGLLGVAGFLDASGSTPSGGASIGLLIGLGVAMLVGFVFYFRATMIYTIAAARFYDDLKPPSGE